MSDSSGVVEVLGSKRHMFSKHLPALILECMVVGGW